MNTEDKLAHLKEILRKMETVLIAYSGGVDSTFLSSVSNEILGQRALAVFGHSPVCPPAELEEAAALAQKLGLKLDAYGFCKTEEFSPLQTSQPGIYVCGVFQGPKDIPETVSQASGAVADAAGLIASARVSLSLLASTLKACARSGGSEPRNARPRWQSR
jgi:heterodisulfide reductase subunit A-like polyferredoxin